MIKRVIALFLCFLLWPLFVLIILLSFILQGRPLFFNQIRLGNHRKPFLLYKLRTMNYQGVTSWGRILRKTGMDELPQLVNIVKGDMAFIGPRPLTEEDILRLKWNSKEYDLRWSVLPGLTGYAQLSTICSREETWIRDKFYCVNHSVLLDFKIIIKTIIILCKGKGDRR